MSYILSRRMRIFWLLIGTITAYWLVYQLLLALFSRDGQLGEFAALMAGLAGNLWTAAVFSWLATGNFFPTSEGGEAAPVGSGTLRTGFIGVPLATALLSVAWLGSWFYVKLLYGSFRRTLLSGEEIGVELSEVEAFKISVEFIGILNFGVTLPLMAATAFILGWACAVSIRFVAMLVPATIYCVIAVVISSGPDVVRTGRPPLYDVLRDGFGAFNDGVTDTELIVLWIIYIMVFPIGPLFYAAYGRIWTAIGFSLRRTVAARESAVSSEI